MSTIAVPGAGVQRATLASTDHKRIAASAGVLSLGFFIAGGVLALIMRTQLAADGGGVAAVGRPADPRRSGVLPAGRQDCRVG